MHFSSFDSTRIHFWQAHIHTFCERLASESPSDSRQITSLATGATVWTNNVLKGEASAARNPVVVAATKTMGTAIEKLMTPGPAAIASTNIMYGAQIHLLRSATGECS